MGLYCESSWGLGWGHIYVRSSFETSRAEAHGMPDHYHRIIISDRRYVLPDPTVRRSVKRLSKAQASVEALRN